jgi:hypothetical protein
MTRYTGYMIILCNRVIPGQLLTATSSDIMRFQYNDSVTDWGIYGVRAPNIRAFYIFDKCGRPMISINGRSHRITEYDMETLIAEHIPY